ncbi:hypothetical protein JHK86_052330 [Glycine max]|nr:hypothetical protein JHK86_052330 [Glycine max]
MPDEKLKASEMDGGSFLLALIAETLDNVLLNFDVGDGILNNDLASWWWRMGLGLGLQAVVVYKVGVTPDGGE